MKASGWAAVEPGAPLRLETRDFDVGPGDVIVQVAGCGVCHTDLGFYYDGVPTRHPWPLILGHEISGTVVAAGTRAGHWLGKNVIVPAVIPCGTCDTCRSGRSSICPDQIFPGSDVDGGFASHVKVPSVGLCPVPNLGDPSVNPHGLDLATLSVIADAVTTPYQAIVRSGLAEGDLAVFIGVGGVGGFGVQIAAAMGAHVAAIDVNPERLAMMKAHGAHLALNAKELDFKAIRNAIRAFAGEHAVPTWKYRIFETSGTPAGQATAFGLLDRGSYLAVVGYTPAKVEVRLSNLMALDAEARGNWGCPPEHYPPVLDLVLAGKVAIAPFTEQRPLASINDSFNDLHEHRVSRRLILVPEISS